MHKPGIISEVLFLLPLHILYCICRYHYNVADSRLPQHVEKGNEDGLHISCVASSSNLWALIMDAGTGYSSQVYELSAVFLHKVVFFLFFFMYCFLLSSVCEFMHT